MSRSELDASTAPPVDPSGKRAWWGDRGVRTKTLAAVGVTAAVAVGIGMMGLSALGAAAGETQRMHDSNVLGLEAVSEMREAIGGVRQASRDAILAPTVESSEEALSHLDEQLDHYAHAVEVYAATDPAAREGRARRQGVGELRRCTTASSRRTSPPTHCANDYAGWYAANQELAKPLADEAQGYLDEVLELEVADADAAAEAAHEHFVTQRTTAVVVLVVGIALAVAVGLFVARGLARGVRRVQDVAEALAAGDLTKTSGLTTRDELGRMGAALDAAVEEIRVVLASVASSADAVAASSEELSASSAQISASAEETSAQSGVVSGAAEEVSAACRPSPRAPRRWAPPSGRSRRTPPRPARSRTKAVSAAADHHRHRREAG